MGWGGCKNLDFRDSMAEAGQNRKKMSGKMCLVDKFIENGW